MIFENLIFYLISYLILKFKIKMRQPGVDDEDGEIKVYDNQ
jgi:hypothetical protein